MNARVSQGAGHPSSASTRHLRGRLAGLRARVALAVSRRREDDTNPDDRFRGLYVSDEVVDGLLLGERPPLDIGDDDDAIRRAAEVERTADADVAAGESVRLRQLATAFNLDEMDADLLLVAVAPDLDPSFERLFAYLNDDVSRRRVSIGVALELCAMSLLSGSARARLGPHGRLVRAGLVLVEEPERPFLTRSLRVPDRVVAHLVEDDGPDPAVDRLMTPAVIAEVEGVPELRHALEAGVGLVYLREGTGAAGLTLAATALAGLGREAISVDLRRLDRADDAMDLMARVCREAGLRGGGVVAGPTEVLADLGPAAVRSLAESAIRPVIMLGSRSWDPQWSRLVPLTMDAPAPTTRQRAAIWEEALGGPQTRVAMDTLLAFRLTPEQIQRAARAADLEAAAARRSADAQTVRAGARAQNAAGLERLARRVPPQVGWDDLVLPPAVLGQLREMVASVRHRELVLDGWGMGHSTSKGRGIKGLFGGDSGTGKTISAEVVAGDLGLDLYVIDLSTVVDKYVGETEKNLDRIFAESERVNGVLLFDEADALFGKRSEVKDAHDRYANVEVAYLLQRMEQFDGLAILTTNLRSNIDEAFARRLDTILDFPMPDEQDRLRLWRLNLRPGLPVESDLDLAFLSEAFELSGGNIRNIVLTAAYLAAEAGCQVGMTELIRGTEREYRKLGRMCVASEFGPYFELLGTRP